MDTNSFLITSHRHKVKDIHINVAEVGRGKPLVFVHGWNNSWIGWTRLAEYLAPHYKLYLMDLPGFGDSDTLNSYSIPILADHIFEYIREYNPNVEALVGGSMGTFILADTVRRHKLNTKLILVGPVFTRNKIRFLSDIYKNILRLSDTRPIHKVFETVIRHRYSAYIVEKYLNAYEFNKQLVDTYQVPGRRKATGKSYVQLGVSMMNYDIESALSKIDNEMLLIWGASDKYTNKKVAEQTIDSFHKENIAMSFVHKSGHSPAYEQPETTSSLILDFLK